MERSKYEFVQVDCPHHNKKKLGALDSTFVQVVYVLLYLGSCMFPSFCCSACCLGRLSSQIKLLLNFNLYLALYYAFF
jgi:hypothetical protein